MKRICVFCGSNPGVNPAFVRTAEELGRYLAENDIELVYGGGRVGLMGRIADAVMQNGGRVTGIIPKSLSDKEVAHQGLSDLHIVDSMHTRKAMMADLSDGFIALPGGFGTFEELCEIITWAQLGFHSKPCGFLNIEGYYDPLVELFDKAVAEQFVRPEHRKLVLIEKEIEPMIGKMKDYKLPSVEKWLEKDDL
ncbi:MAG: TIGR00730 family Rossman fold protein [Pyrinomonadaceae bacterium]